MDIFCLCNFVWQVSTQHNHCAHPHVSSNLSAYVVQVGVEGKVLGNGLSLKVQAATPHNRKLKNKVETAGAQILAEMMLTPKFPHGMLQMARESIVNNQDFLNNNSSFCVAYVANSKVLEVYRFIEPCEGYGYIELVNVVDNVKQVPEWRNILVQVSRGKITCSTFANACCVLRLEAISRQVICIVACPM